MKVSVTTLISVGAYEFEIEAQGEVTHDPMYSPDADVGYDWISVSPPIPAEGPWVALYPTQFSRRFGADAICHIDGLMLEQYKEFSDMMDDRRADYELDRMRDEEF